MRRSFLDQTESRGRISLVTAPKTERLRPPLAWRHLRKAVREVFEQRRPSSSHGKGYLPVKQPVWGDESVTRKRLRCPR